MVTVSELIDILDQYNSTDQVLGFKVIIKRKYSTSVHQSHNWPKLDSVQPQTSAQGESAPTDAEQANYAICHSCGVKLAEPETHQKNCPYCGEQI